MPIYPKGVRTMDRRLQDYRNFLVEAERKAQEDYDKTILSLSGGALGISFAFLKDFVVSSPTYRWTLFASWIAWGLSMAFVLTSFYSSQQALRKAIEQVDADSIRQQVPGGFFSQLTTALNVLSGLLFFVGVLLIAIFVSYNWR